MLKQLAHSRAGTVVAAIERLVGRTACVPVTLVLLTLVAAAPSIAGEKNLDWAYQPLSPALPPTVTDNRHWVRRPIDAFILAGLKSKNLSPGAAADRGTLLRRVYFDLIGLPPTPEELRQFLANQSPDAYERAVEELLSSSRYGERWARHWMDAIHFAETHGHDQDRIRTNAWPYRDYLINSFNADRPYPRFAQEQVAGDVLFPDDPQATIALGLIAAGPWDESSLRDIREDTIDREIGRYLDRDDMVTTVMQTFTSITVQCARCHDHKFDPVPQRDYFALQAVFAGVERANRAYDLDAVLHLRRQTLLRDRRRVLNGDREFLLGASSAREVEAWERTRVERKVDWHVLQPQTFISSGGAKLTRQADDSLLASGPRPDRDIYTITANSPLPRLTGVQLEVMADASLPHQGPGRQDNGNLHLTEVQLLLFEPGSVAAREIALTKPSADFNQSGWTIEQALDQNEKTAWGIHPRVGETHQAVFEFQSPLSPPAGATLGFVIKQLHGDGHLIGRLRLSVTSSQPPIRASMLPAEVAGILGIPRPGRSPAQQSTLAGFVLKERIALEIGALPKPSLIYAAAADFEPDGGLKPAGAPRPIHTLKRGDIRMPLEPALPGALSCVSTLSARFEAGNGSDEGSRRASLARWLTDRENPLFWRSIVNRVWHHHFGRGLVETPNDFGKMGAVPSHPELLDWLAIWFRDEARGSLKQLHRLIVTSAVYRQASTAEGRFPPPADPDNRLFWRMSRTRLDAEQVRDAVLQISGWLDLRMGGPSDQRFDLQPGHHVTPKVDYSNFDLDSPAARRRSVYRFLFRTLPEPFMEALDCPAGDQLAPVRNAGVTVQQALAMWNNVFMAHYAARFAARLETLAGTKEAQISLACELALSRPPSSGELEEFASYAKKHGLGNFCRLLLNSNEFMFLN